MDFPFAVSQMLRDLLAAEDIKVGRLHVSTLMKKMAIEAIYRRPNTSKPAPGHKIYPYLLRRLAVTRPNQVWGSMAVFAVLRQRNCLWVLTPQKIRSAKPVDRNRVPQAAARRPYQPLHPRPIRLILAAPVAAVQSDAKQRATDILVRSPGPNGVGDPQFGDPALALRQHCPHRCRASGGQRYQTLHSDGS